MKLRDRFGLSAQAGRRRDRAPPRPPRCASSRAGDPVDRSYQELKLRIHRELIDRIDLDTLGAHSTWTSANAELRGGRSRSSSTSRPMPLSQRDRERLVDEILDEVFGLGPLEPLLRDPEVSRHPGQQARSRSTSSAAASSSRPTVVFRDDAHLLQIIDRIVSRGRPPRRRVARRWSTPACPTARA